MKTLVGIDKYSNSIAKLNDMQKLMGWLNHIAQMCSFIKIPLQLRTKVSMTSLAMPTLRLLLEFQIKLGWVFAKRLQMASNTIRTNSAAIVPERVYTDAAGLPSIDQLSEKLGCGGVVFFGDRGNKPCFPVHLAN
jgi:hypothetical protein